MANVNIDNITHDLQLKQDKDGLNATHPIVISRSESSGGGIVEIWSDGYCVQTGHLKEAHPLTVTFENPFKDTNYVITISQHGSMSASIGRISIDSKTTDSFQTAVDANMLPSSYRVEGYIR